MQARGSSSWRVRPSKAGEAPRPFPGSDVLGQFAEEGINPPDSLCPHPATHITALVLGAGTKGLLAFPIPGLSVGDVRRSNERTFCEALSSFLTARTAQAPSVTALSDNCQLRNSSREKKLKIT